MKSSCLGTLIEYHPPRILQIESSTRQGCTMRFGELVLRYPLCVEPGITVWNNETGKRLLMLQNPIDLGKIEDVKIGQ